MVALLGSGLSAYLLGKTLAGGEGKQMAGLVSAAAYVYSPYLLYTANVRGGLPENLALAFLPLAFWGLYESLKQPLGWDKCVSHDFLETRNADPWKRHD